MFDDYYGLTGRPFELTPDPAFYFDSAAHRKALGHVRYGLAQGEGRIFVTGDIGSGKSTLVSHLLGVIDSRQLTAVPLATGRADDEPMVQLVALSFGLQIQGAAMADARVSIETFLRGEVRAGRRGLLIVDDAQKLTIEALEDLRTLSDSPLGGRPLLQALLLGRPELRAKLTSHAVHEGAVAHHLEPLARAELEPYIVGRLKRVGWSGLPQFDQRVFAELHAASAGIPLRINQIAGRLLRLGAVEGRSRIDAVMLKVVLDEMAAERAVAAEPASAGLVSLSPPGGQPQLVDHAAFVAALAERDLQIAELQQALVELAGQQETAGRELGSAIEALAARVAAVEARAGEQDRVLRRTVGMLIEWIEGEIEPSRAA
jgi:general secretion pathway protein A